MFTSYYHLWAKLKTYDISFESSQEVTNATKTRILHKYLNHSVLKAYSFLTFLLSITPADRNLNFWLKSYQAGNFQNVKSLKMHQKWRLKSLNQQYRFNFVFLFIFYCFVKIKNKFRFSAGNYIFDIISSYQWTNVLLAEPVWNWDFQPIDFGSQFHKILSKQW